MYLVIVSVRKIGKNILSFLFNIPVFPQCFVIYTVEITPKKLFVTSLLRIYSGSLYVGHLFNNKRFYILLCTEIHF